MNRWGKIAFLVSIFIGLSCAAQNGGPKQKKLRPPVWLRNLPEKEGWLFALGEAGPHYFDHKGWKSAEKNARENLALAIQTRVKGEYISVEGIPGQPTRVEVTKEVLDIALYGSQVLERYKDPTTGYYYVLVGISTSNAAENIIRQGRKALEEKGEKEAARAIEERKKEMIEKLEKRLEGE